MEIANRHERVIAASRERVDELVGGFFDVWPTGLAATPRPAGDGRHDTGLMVAAA